jgi:hypothetical protein
MAFRYQERMRLSDYQMEFETSWESIERAHLIWSLDGESDKLEAERRKANN